MFRATLATAALLASVGVLWLAGEQRAENCIRAGKVECSAMPWTGEKPPPTGAGTTCTLPPSVCEALRNR